MINKCFKEVAGFQELAQSNDIKICFLHDPEFGYKDGNPKRPEGRTKQIVEELCAEFLEENGVSSFEELGMVKSDYVRAVNGKFNYRTVEEANLYKNCNRNLGFVLPKESTDLEEFWVSIDIDGQDHTYMVEKDMTLKKGTRRYLFECIKNGLKSRNIKFVCNTTANDGFHIYFKTKEALFRDHGFNTYTYPTSQELISKISPNVLYDYPVLNSIIGQKMANKAIEVFTNGKFVVAPGSVINGKKYALLPDGVQDFREVTVYDGGPVEELIGNILKDDCYFVQDTTKKIEKKQNDVNISVSDDKQNFSATNIKNIGDFIIYAFQHISGQKHYATLALGGFLYNQNISQNSIMALGDYIINNAPDGLFKESDEVERTVGFMQVLLHDSLENSDKEKTGLTTLKDIFRDTPVPLRELTKILWINSAPKFHRFYPDGIEALNYKEVVIDFNNRETKLYNLKKHIVDGEEKPPIVTSVRSIQHVLTDMSYIDDISSSPIARIEKMPIMFTIRSRLMQDTICIEDNTQDMIDNYSSLRLAHSSGARDILALVMDEYESIGLIGQVEMSKIPGIYLSRDKTTLRKFISSKGEIVEVFPDPPDPSNLQNALNLLKQINDAYPWFDDKFATFVKLGMILPYSFVFKSEYGSFIRGIILYGEAGTCKSSASELIEYMNVPSDSIKERELDYLVPGSEFSTVYRMGNALNKHSYPIAIEEVENIFDVAENRDLIKNAITRKFIRNPGGEQEYYSRAIPVFSANELNDEIEKSGMFRRFLILNFINGERGDKDDVEKALSFLNENGVRNSRFKELYVIAEYIFYNLSNHLEYFAKSPQGIIDSILLDMQEYVEMDLSWLIEPQFDKYYQKDRSSEDQTDFAMVLDTLKYPFKSSVKLSGIASNVNERFIENLIEDKYSYIYRIKNNRNNGIIITSDFNKSYKRSYPEAKKISLDRFTELLNENLELKYEIKKAKMKPANFKKRVSGIYMDWEDFLNIFNVKIDDEE